MLSSVDEQIILELLRLESRAYEGILYESSVENYYYCSWLIGLVELGSGLYLALIKMMPVSLW
jgi:hypothetical protein